MDIIQVIIFIIIIVAAIVQQISKTGKEKKTPSPKKVLADMFPEIEQENIGGTFLFLPFKQSAHLRLPACSISRWSRNQQIHPGKRTKGKTGLL